MCINDIGGNSLPIGEIVFYGTKGDQLIFEKNFEGITADNNFEATINYYNGNIGLWEPVLEPWKFKLRINIPEDSEREIVFKIYSEMASPLNLDYSDDFVILLLKTIQQWDSYLSSEFEEEKESPIKENYKMLTPGESISILSRKHEFEVEYISACTIINDTGYDIEVTPTEVENSKQFSTLKLEANERKDLLVEWAIEQASGGSKNLQNLKAAVKIHLREQKIDLFNFDIVNKGSRMQEFFMNDGRKGTVLCTVDFENEKKIVRFSSQYIVCNQLNEDIFIRILDKESLQTILIIPAFKEKSLPVDKIESSISFGHHAEIEDYPFYYELNRLIEQNETKIGGLYAYIRSEITKSFTQIIVEPLYSVRNCLPFTVSISLADKQKNIMEIVEGQTEIQVCQFPSINDVMMTLVTDNYMTNDYNLNTSDGKLYFGLGPYNLELEVAVMKKSESRTKRFIIFCTSCVLNLSGKELDFMNDVGVGLFEMAYSENLKIFLFNGLNRLRIKEKSEEFPHDKERGYIDIDAIGNYDHDIVDKKGKLTNLTLQVSNECCGIIFLYCNTLDTEYNFLTKIVRVYPKIVFINHTRHEIGIEQLQSLEVLSFPPETTRPLHFKVPATE